VRLVRGSSFLVAIAMLLGAVPGAAAASSIIECGQVVAYTAPDSGTATDGSLTLGMLPAWVIDADAVIGAAAAATLPSFAGSGPSCLAMDLDDDGVITALDFSAEGTLTGPVVVDSGLGGFVFDDRIFIPTFVTDAYPGLAAIFATSAAAGTRPTATFQVDTSTGQFTGFDARAGFCGAGDLAGNGDGRIGAATIPAAVLDAGDAAILAAANGEEICAAVHAVGSIGGSGLTIDTDVRFALTPNTSTVMEPAGQVGGTSVPIGFVGALGAVMLLIRLTVGRSGSRADQERRARR
jgi:hypothetical protein